MTKRIAIGLLVTAAVALPAFMFSASSASASVNFGISVSFGPPPLPWYPQPVLAAPGYIWVPGYWAYGPYGYYWVPGAWVLPPTPGLLWTPGYWAFTGGYYRWCPGYWGPRVGFYGGINYGYGYPGRGYNGGYWQHGRFYYNRSVVNVNIRNVHYVYNQPVAHENRGLRVSYNGPGGVTQRPTRQQVAWAREQHIGPTAEQARHGQIAMSQRAMPPGNHRGDPGGAGPPRGSQPPYPGPAGGPYQGAQPPYPNPAAGPNQGYGAKPPYPQRPASPEGGWSQPPHPQKPKHQDNRPKPPPPAGMRTLPRVTPTASARRQVRQPPQNEYRGVTDIGQHEKRKNHKHPPA